ncbi:MAG: hypothetical protein DMF24_07100 [Verrucomicrobia bacterium]|nr:MAG: hypothetical protein DMF24_07100 [Verrucomicrobiota bacterium]
MRGCERIFSGERSPRRPGFGVAPKRTLVKKRIFRSCVALEKVCDRETRSPTRETRVPGSYRDTPR